MDQVTIDDLGRSGLVPDDMGIRDAGAPEFAAAKVPVTSKGYVIPYYNLDGDRLAFYRLRLFNYTVEGKTLKYKQLSGSTNHIYFPKSFQEAVANIKRETSPFERPFVMLTEGEKKATAVCKAGIPCVAVGGADSWRNRTLILPSESVLEKAYAGTKNAGNIKVKLPAGAETFDESSLAQGMKDLIDFLLQKQMDIIICYDTDSPEGMKFDVQRAASSLGYELRYNGVPTTGIRQLILPYSADGKVGVDDYLNAHGADGLTTLIKDVQLRTNAFPRHPNARQLIAQKLQKKLNRRETQEVSLSILADLDAHGRRFRSSNDGSPYYFNDKTHALMPASLLDRSGDPLHETLFGTFLYRNYGIGGADSRIIQWLAAQFTGEQPVQEVEPRRVTALAGKNKDEIAIQISDSHFVVVTADPENPFKILPNGSYGLLFEQGQVEEITPGHLREELEKQKTIPFKPWWYEVITKQVNLSGGEDSAKLATLLYYISPFLLRWKGTQLPIEITIGEPGSGKSSLYELRLGILTGNPKLRNVPRDLRDWYASISHTGGVHVIDNLQFTNKELRQGMSDEICRLVTEPNPAIEMRRLYTTSGQDTLPINTVFAFTAIQQPFYNNDVMQRAAVFEMSAVGTGHNATWVSDQLSSFGGRVAWLAHHLHVLHKFLLAAKTKWNPNYRASHRLANYEQCLALMAEVLSLGEGTTQVSQVLMERMQRNMTDADWTLEAVKEYIQEMLKAEPGGFEFSAASVSAWAEGHAEHYHNTQLTNSRSLGRYLVAHQTMLKNILGMQAAGSKNNKKMFKILGDGKSKPKSKPGSKNSSGGP